MISRVLNVINVVRHYLVMEKFFPDTNMPDILVIIRRMWSLLTHMTTRWLRLFTCDPELYEDNYVQGKQYQVVRNKIAVRVRV